jgi:diaminopimelate epimerase
MERCRKEWTDMSTEISYTVVDPGGNITALVRSSVPRDMYTQIARRICVAQPEIEQVGFLSRSSKADVCLEMEGGEFCGNALRAAGAIMALELDKETVLIETDLGTESFCVTYIDGVSTVHVPRNILSLENTTCPLPGISHILHMGASDTIHTMSDFMTPALSDKKAVGLMEYTVNPHDRSYVLTPTVWVRALNTTVTETACASGTIALAEYLYRGEGLVTATVMQPSGALFTTSITEEQISLSGPICDIYTSVLV